MRRHYAYSFPLALSGLETSTFGKAMVVRERLSEETNRGARVLIFRGIPPHSKIRWYPATPNNTLHYIPLAPSNERACFQVLRDAVRSETDA